MHLLIPKFQRVFIRQLPTLHCTCYRIDTWAIRRPWLTFVNALANSILGRFYTAMTQTARKWQKRVWVWCLKVILSLCNHAKPYSLAWWSLTAQAKDPFQDSKELKMNWTVAMFQQRLSISIRYIKSDKLRQKNCNECLDNFVMKKARTKAF